MPRRVAHASCGGGLAATATPCAAARMERIECGTGWAGDVVLLPIDREASDAGAYESAGIALPEALRTAVPARRAAHLHGRLAARIALERLGFRGTHVGIGARGEPIWPDGVVGSITHAGLVAAAIVARCSDARGIGIDVEAIGTTLLDAGARRIVMDDAEAHVAMEAATGSWPGAGEHGADAAISCATTPGGAPSAVPAAALSLTAVFSAKESVYKAVFPTCHRFLDFGAVRLEALDAAAGVAWMSITRTLDATLPQGRVLPVRILVPLPGHVMTVCHLAAPP